MRLLSFQRSVRLILALVAGCILFPGNSFGQSKRPEPATTADEFIEQLQTSRPFLYTPPNLSGEELEKAKKQLRAMFPFQSIRDRLDFNESQPPTGRYSSERRARALVNLHTDHVENFIKAEGQGFSRRPTNPRYLFPHKKIKLAETFYPDPVSSEIQHEEVVELDHTIRMKETKYRGRRRGQEIDANFIHSLDENGMPRQKFLSNLNSSFTDGFSSRTGLVASLDAVSGFETHRVRRSESWTGKMQFLVEQEDASDESPPVRDESTSWKVNRIQLISLLMHDEPCVYTSDNLPNMEELSSETAETRPLKPFESEALEQFESGEKLQVRATLNRIVMVGSIRAEKNCLQCHSGKENELLGAFSYEILRTPKVETVPKKKEG